LLAGYRRLQTKTLFRFRQFTPRRNLKPVTELFSNQTTSHLFENYRSDPRRGWEKIASSVR